MFLGTSVRALGIVWISSHSFGVGIVHRLFFWIPYFVRNVLKNFDNFSQPAKPVGEPDWLVHKVIFSGTVVRALVVVWVSSHSSEFRIERLFVFCFWIPYSEEFFDIVS